jgi:hypothetical protein
MNAVSIIIRKYIFSGHLFQCLFPFGHDFT